MAEDEALVQELRDRVAAPSVAAPAEQNRVGKKLLEEGRDGRRPGAKRN